MNFAFDFLVDSNVTFSFIILFHYNGIATRALILYIIFVFQLYLYSSFFPLCIFHVAKKKQQQQKLKLKKNQEKRNKRKSKMPYNLGDLCFVSSVVFCNPTRDYC